MHNIDEWFSDDENVEMLINQGPEVLADKLFNRTKCKIENSISETINRALKNFAGEAVFMDFAGINWNEMALLYEVCRYRIKGSEGFEENFGAVDHEELLVFGWIVTYERFKGHLHTGEDAVEFVIEETTTKERIEAAMTLLSIVFVTEHTPASDANNYAVLYFRMLFENGIEQALIRMRQQKESLALVYSRTRHFMEEVNHGQAML